MYASAQQPLLIDSWGESGLSGAPVVTLEASITDPKRRMLGIYTGRKFTKASERNKEQSLGMVTPTEDVIRLTGKLSEVLHDVNTSIFR